MAARLKSERPTLEWLQCPSCGGSVALPSDPWPGRRVGCLHCGQEAWLERDDGDEAPGSWVLSSEWSETER